LTEGVSGRARLKEVVPLVQAFPTPGHRTLSAKYTGSCRGELTENKGVCRGDTSFLTGWAGSQIQITPETRTWMESPVQGLSKTGPRSRKGILEMEPKLFHRVDRI
jgi:hypothetical protein